jgi:hypothetical protein
MNNLSAERVLFAFAKAAGEDYLFRLINPGMAASRRRFAGSEPAIETTAPRSGVNERPMTGDILASLRVCPTQDVLRRLV